MLEYSVVGIGRGEGGGGRVRGGGRGRGAACGGACLFWPGPWPRAVAPCAPRIFLSASCCAHKYLLQLIIAAFASSWNASALSSTVRTAASSKGVPVERIFFLVGVGVKVVFCLPGSTTRTGMVLGCYLLLRSLVFAVTLAAPRRRAGYAGVWYLPLLLEMRPYSPFAAKRHAALREHPTRLWTRALAIRDACYSSEAVVRGAARRGRATLACEAL